MDPVMDAPAAVPEPDVIERAEGTFLGAAVGDALGWPVEDRSGRVGGRRDLQPAFEFNAWRRREGGRFQPHEEEIAPGSYSDDTQLMLAVARARLAGAEWWSRLTRHELPFWLLYERGGGGATKRAAASWSRGKPPWADKEAKRYFEAGGNGVAMRIAAHCLVPTSTSFDEVAKAVVADGIATHGHPRALVGAVLQASAIRRSLAQRGVLGYGELLEDVSAAPEWRVFPEPREVVPEWEQLASRHLDRPFRDVWNDVVQEVEEMLAAAKDGIARGSLAVDRPVLEQLGAFGQSSGAGTVTAVGAIFLASRYAAQPSGGVVAASFAKGADTDTLAAMTGAILGAIHGTDWLTTITRTAEDAPYARRLARRLLEPPGVAHSEVEDTPPPTTRTFWRRFGEPQVGDAVELPGGRNGKVTGIRQHATKRADLLPLTWVVETDDGQTLHFKRVKKVPKTEQHAPTQTEQAATPTAEVDRRPRIGVVLHVADLQQARRFYKQVVGLQISKDEPERTVFAGLLALEPLPRSLKAERENEQLALDGADQRQSFDTTCAVTIYVHKTDFEDIRRRIANGSRSLSGVTQQEGRPTFRCLDPDGNVVEFRCRNGF